MIPIPRISTRGNATRRARGRPWGRSRRVVGLGLVLAAVAALQGACLFDTRTPEPPSQGRAVVSLESPERAFEAIRVSLADLTDADYERALSDRFRFYPLVDDSLDQNFIGTTVYADWNKTVELDVLGTLLGESSRLTVTWSPSTLINENTFVRFSAGYTLEVVSRIDGSRTLYGGRSEIDVENEGGNWRIVQWRDVAATDSTRSWGFLRGLVRRRLNP